MGNSFLSAVRSLRRGDLSWSAVLTEEEVRAALPEGYQSGSRLYTPITTICTFLAQVLGSDHSCQDAVDGLVADRVASGQDACSSDTGGYCKARKRLPEETVWRLMRNKGREVERQAPEGWRWCDRRVRAVDGSTVRIADTADNRKEYPLQEGLRVGTSYPIVRILVIFSLAVGTVLDAAIRPYQGKGTGETGMLRDLADQFQPGDVLLGDRYFAGYWDLAWWKHRQVDWVVRNSASRKSDFRRGKRLGKDDHVIIWNRTARPDWITPEDAAVLPKTLVLREVRVHVRIPGFRTETVILITTLLDHRRYSKKDLASLYRRRWQAELNLRSLKTHMKMEQLRCKTPPMVRKEFAMHLLGYNCVRQVAAVAGEATQQEPWKISFNATRQALNQFVPRLPQMQDVTPWITALLETIVEVEVGNRPGRIEPRATKTPPKDYPRLKQPRSKYKNQYRNAA